MMIISNVFKNYIFQGGVTPSTDESACYLDKVGHIHGHLLNASVVKLFRVLQSSFIFGSDEINSHALPTETTTSSNPEGGDNTRLDTSCNK